MTLGKLPAYQSPQMLRFLPSKNSHSKDILRQNHSPSGAQDSPRQSRWNHSTGHIGLSQAIISPYSPWPQKQNTSFPTKDRYHFSQKQLNTARLIFLGTPFSVTFILVASCCLYVLFLWWTRPRGIVATFQHLLQLRVFPLQVLVFLHQIDCSPSSQLSSVPQK